MSGHIVGRGPPKAGLPWIWASPSLTHRGTGYVKTMAPSYPQAITAIASALITAKTKSWYIKS